MEAAQVDEGLGERARAGGELEQLDLDIVELAQCGDLVADEAPELGTALVGLHVGDDERAHGTRR